MKKQRGRPAHKPTDDLRRRVRNYSGLGLTNDEIAHLVGISRPTLVKYYSEDIQQASAEKKAAVMGSLIKAATRKTNPNITAAIFWLKCQAGWNDQPGYQSKKEKANEKAQTAAEGSDEWSKLLQ